MRELGKEANPEKSWRDCITLTWKKNYLAGCGPDGEAGGMSRIVDMIL
jgi:hypothetical protein